MDVNVRVDPPPHQYGMESSPREKRSNSKKKGKKKKKKDRNTRVDKRPPVPMTTPTTQYSLQYTPEFVANNGQSNIDMISVSGLLQQKPQPVDRTAPIGAPTRMGTVMNGHTPNVSVDSQISHLSHYHKNGDRKTMFKVRVPQTSRRKEYHNVATRNQNAIEDQRRDYYGASKQKGYYEVGQRLEEDTDDSTDDDSRYRHNDSEVVNDMQYHNVNRPRNRDDSVFLPVNEPQHEKQKTRSTNKSNNSSQSNSTKSHGRKPAVFVHMQ